MTQNILKLLFVFLFAFGLVSCTKEVPPELLNNKQKEQTNNGQPEMPDDSIHRNLSQKIHFTAEVQPVARMKRIWMKMH